MKLARRIANIENDQDRLFIYLNEVREDIKSIRKELRSISREPASILPASVIHETEQRVSAALRLLNGARRRVETGTPAKD